MIDLSLLRGVWVDPERRVARAQAGCTLGDVDRETQLHGLAAVLGFVSATGDRRTDRRRRLRLPDATPGLDLRQPGVDGGGHRGGEVLRAPPDENADLFWALRGGSGNFGIVTSFEYSCPGRPRDRRRAIAWRGEDASRCSRPSRVQRRGAARADQRGGAAHGAARAVAAEGGARQADRRLFVCHSGKLEDGEALLAPLRQLGRPVADIVTRRPYAQMQSLLDATQPKGRRYYWKSHYLADIDDRMIELAAEHADRFVRRIPPSCCSRSRGALNERPAGYSPAGNRDAAYVLKHRPGQWENAGRRCGETSLGRATASRRRVRARRVAPTSTSSPRKRGATAIEAAYGRADLERLAALKHRTTRTICSVTPSVSAP
jgi:hypothetical protein